MVMICKSCCFKDVNASAHNVVVFFSSPSLLCSLIKRVGLTYLPNYANVIHCKYDYWKKLSNYNLRKLSPLFIFSDSVDITKKQKQKKKHFKRRRRRAEFGAFPQ